MRLNSAFCKIDAAGEFVVRWVKVDGFEAVAAERKETRTRKGRLEKERVWQRVGFRTWDGKGGDSGDSLSDSLLSFLRAEILLGPRASVRCVCVYTYCTYMCNDTRYLASETRLKSQTFPSVLFRFVSLDTFWSKFHYWTNKVLNLHGTNGNVLRKYCQRYREQSIVYVINITVSSIVFFIDTKQLEFS